MPTLQEFVTDYIETIGGDCDEVEPQVYDILLPDNLPANTSDDEQAATPMLRIPSLRELANRDVLRVAYDPEAVPEHPGSQLVSFGTPLVDAMLADAVRRGRTTTAYFTGLNLQARELPTKIRRTIKLPDGVDWTFEDVRFFHYPQAVFWFEATFASDLKEQSVLPIGFDLALRREVRRLDQLLDFEHLSQRPMQSLIEAAHADLTEVYLKARQEAVRTVSALGNIRRRELDGRLEKQVARMQLYYGDLRKELAEQGQRGIGQPTKAATKKEPVEAVPDAGSVERAKKFASRLDTINREESQRIAELRQKSELKITLRLANLLIVQLPKVCVLAVAHGKRGTEEVSEPMELVWNPLMEQLEAVTCPVCGGPAFEFHWASRSSRTEHPLICGQCGS